ncbi:hypothetical protein D3879_01240 [Pseudomonas cavernicola]|uniref:Type 4 fimbrial biogenesis protein PilX N-terminal domain-containing protein n=1 Tax=Pseudomonas cavernicola TaxID=2320866 RepID=A0A418XHP5_9PSED|nr:PilX N-terminal domain-containing pilus assembly protein [Pseudomonas cavernicola]RJG11982.1 hypothetical protein D3879_01240 [Pseudomonas cavernicola]
MIKKPGAMGERGAALVVGLIMLLLLTLMVSGAFTLSTVNLKSVGNMQMREEALAAANSIMERVLGSMLKASTTTPPVGETGTFDVNNDGTNDYTVIVATPECIRAVVSGAAPKCEVGMVCPSDTWNTVWELRATVTDPASGASSVVRSGVRVLLTQAQKNAVCP